MLCSWEGNRRSGVALAMRHRLSGLSMDPWEVSKGSMVYPPTGSKANVREMNTPIRSIGAWSPLPYLYHAEHLCQISLKPELLLFEK